MAPNTLDPEEALDLLGLEEELTDSKPAEPDVLEVEFPPMQQKPPPAAASAAAGGGVRPSGPTAPAAAAAGAPADAELRKEVAALKAARDKAEADRTALEQKLRAALDSEKKSADRARKLEEELAAARKTAGASTPPADTAALHKELEALRSQVAILQKGGLGADSEGPAPKEGSLDQYPYARLLVRLLRNRFTGRVLLKTGTAKREVYFDQGAPVAFSSSEPGERLGRVLVTSGIITEEQYLAAARAMVEQGQKLTEALLEMGAISNERLQQEQRQITREQIVSGFGLTQGTFVLEAGKAPPDEVARFEFSLGEVWLAGYRKHAPEADVATAYDTMKESYVRARDDMAALRPQLALDQDDERVLKLLGEAYTLSEAVERSGSQPQRGARLLAALKQLGLIEEWKPGVAEFEARLKNEKLRLAEETVNLKQRMADREERLFVDIESALKRLETRPVAGPATAAAPAAPAAPSVSPDDLHRVEAALQQHLDAGLRRVEQSLRDALKEGIKAAALAAPPASGPSLAPPPTGSNLGAQLSGVPPVRKTGANLGPSLASPPASSPSMPSADVQLDGDDGPGHERYKEGMRQAAAGRLDEAESALREAVRLDATKPAYLTALARVLLANPRYERAGTLPVVRSLLDRAQSLAPGDAEVSALLQRIQQEMT